MRTWEVMQISGKKFRRKSDGLIIEIETDGTLNWESGYKHLSINDEWEEVKEPVSFIEAVKSGKYIGVEYSGAVYNAMNLPNLFYELQQDYSDKTIRQIILKGN